jgi:large subunit ribosomal protein L2
VPATVIAIEYDPNRSARIALLQYEDGEKRYILCPLGLKVGDRVESGPEAEIRVGNALPLRNIPTGTVIHNIELYPGKGGQMVRSAGAAAQLIAKEGDYGLLRMPSGEMRRVRLECMATIGQVGNVEHNQISLGKAGRSRHRGIRPTGRWPLMAIRSATALSSALAFCTGLPGPKTPWGKPALGYRTRHNKRTDKYIVRRRTK